MAALELLMSSDTLSPFRLVGGTALSLQIGHRLSVDIDLFTDAEYKSIDFEAIDSFLRREFSYVDSPTRGEMAFGKSYYVGSTKEECIKLDLFYTDPFIREATIVDNLRMATLEEIAAMKVDVISRNGRKKDFWDLHQLLKSYSVERLIALHQERYPYTHTHEEVISQLTNFSFADNDFDPICLLRKEWEVIKLDLVELLEEYTNTNTNKKI